MRYPITLCTVLLVWAAPIAQEIAVPNTPIVATITSYEIVSFEMERIPEWSFRISYRDSNEKMYVDQHRGQSMLLNGLQNPNAAEPFLRQLNTANFATNSLVKRLLQHLVQHGKIPAATVQGTPEG